MRSTAAISASRLQPGSATRLPREARDGLTRAWLGILTERHPGVVWVACHPDDDDAAEEEPPETRQWKTGRGKKARRVDGGKRILVDVSPRDHTPGIG
jgi:hypothetical protein